TLACSVSAPAIATAITVNVATKVVDSGSIPSEPPVSGNGTSTAQTVSAPAPAPNTAGVTTIGGIQFDANGNMIRQTSTAQPCIMCHGMTGAGQTGSVTQFAGLSAIPGSGANAQQGYSTLVTLSANAVFTFGPGIAGGIARLGATAATTEFAGVFTGTMDVSGNVATYNVGVVVGDSSTILTGLRTITQQATTAGADTLVINTGHVVNEGLAASLAARAQSGATLFGGTVRQVYQGAASPIFTITIPIPPP
ncbi:MAG TPA: hypothetical protein VHE61_07685, partial [Opitutaceae bacterium]|nr:hypothetical protein [Opitutaceae bacterium]